MVYTIYIMRRTQIYLSEEQGTLLRHRSRASGRTISELIRAAIDATYSRRQAMSRSEKVLVARRTAGSWKDFPETGATYVERMRGARRLSGFHRSG